MVGVHARGVVAGVADERAVRNGAIVDHVACPMSPQRAALVGYHPRAARLSSQPRPALVGTFSVGPLPEPFFERRDARNVAFPRAEDRSLTSFPSECRPAGSAC